MPSDMNYWHRRWAKYATSLIPCSCGCGTLIPSINKLGKPARFAHGHNAYLRTPEQMHKMLQSALAVTYGIPKPKGTLAAHWKGGRMVSKRGYIRIYFPSHPRANSDGYVPEHWLVMEQKLGRNLTPNEQIHHINGNPSDNSPDNLMLLTAGEHTNLHRNNGDLHNQDGDNHARALKAWETRRRNQTHTSIENLAPI